MLELKPLPKENIPAALEKARCYRFLNEPLEAESICLDILAVDPENQQALITLILSLTDQFADNLTPAYTRASELLASLTDRFHQKYYQGIISERRAKMHLNHGGPGSGKIAYEWLQKAMALYADAMNMSLETEEEAVLRWNACARLLARNPGITSGETGGESMLE